MIPKEISEEKAALIADIDAAIRIKITEGFFDPNWSRIPIYVGDIVHFEYGDAIFDSKPKFVFCLYNSLGTRVVHKLNAIKDPALETRCAAFVETHADLFTVNQ